MKFLGFNITKSADPGVAALSQIRDGNPSQVQMAMNNWILRKIDPNFFEVLREAIPMNDTAINKLISINGRIEIIGEKADCVAELQDFCRFVPVGPMAHGIDEYRKAMWGEGFEQGFGYGELAATSDLKDIEGLRVADSKYIIFWKNAAGIAEPWYLYPDTDKTRPLTDPAELIGQIVNARFGTRVNFNQSDMVKLNPANKFYLAPMIENSNPYGISLFRSQPWVAQILATLQNSMKNSADRFGDPMYHAHSSGKVSADKISALVKELTDQLTRAITIKRAGGSADIVTAGGEASKVEIRIIGHEGQLFPYEIPLRHVEEQIVASSGLPAWMLGKYWSTTERMAQLEVEIVLADGSMRNTAETPGLIRLFSAVLAMRGKKWKTITTDIKKPGDWGFRFIQPNLHNEVQTAQANFLNAEAESMRQRGTAGAPAASVRNEGTEVPVGGAAAGMVTIKSEGMDIQVPLLPGPGSRVQGSGNKHPLPSVGEDRGEGATSRDAHKEPCSCGKSHPLHPSPVTLPTSAKELSRPFPWPELDKIEAEYEAALKYDWNELKQKVFKIAGLKVPDTQDAGKTLDPAAKAFSFGDEERKQIMNALDDFLGIYEPADPDSPVKWAYMQSYSLGLMKAAVLMGKERPLLDILKNKEIFDKIVAGGFKLVKNDATSAIKDLIIPAMEAGTINGSNPFDVARELDKRFGETNKSWERLARTEMNGSAQEAKRDEWDARGVDVSNYINGPRDIHPRCRCDSTVRLVEGKWVMVFVPSPDACPACQAAAEGDKAA